MRIITALVAVLLLVSCKEKLIAPPENLIPEDQMTEILYDLALMNGLKGLGNKVLEAHQIEPMPYLYKKYQIDSLQFVQSDNYYASIPATYHAMYTTIQKRITTLEDQEKEERNRKRDSVNAQTKKIQDSLKKKSGAKTSAPPPEK